ncbi:MAG TPA: hypothetical protein DCL38_00470 [Lachnospiraceae bacterium]|nr:hypothetical protein [Lachnospiraceae bacterium]
MKRLKRDKQELYRIVREYGADVLKSEAFRAGCGQRHHIVTTVTVHSRKVAMYTVLICRKLKELGIETDERSIVRAALCHDLGMVGRREKFRNNSECSKKHPIDSVKLAREIYPDMNERMENAIRWHMWPMVPHMPATSEEIILIMADKLASLGDMFKYSGRRFRRLIHRGREYVTLPKKKGPLL